MIHTAHYENSPITIIGGGIGGCITALRLAELGLRVTIIDKNPELLSSTSDKTPGRLGLGFHYFGHIATAFKYLRATVNFVKKHPGYMLGDDDNAKAYLARGRYLVTNDSLTSGERFLAMANALRKSYHNLIIQDPNNQVFGKAEDFYRILPAGEYQNDVNRSLISLAVETQERLLNWPKFKVDLLKKLHRNNFITILTNHAVSEVKYQSSKKNYLIMAKQGNLCKLLTTNFVVNCAWENMEAINAKLDYQNEFEVRTNRVKLLAEVELPEELYHTHSMFFCQGAHAMFSNQDHGIGRITYAPITNHLTSTDLQLSDKMQDWLQNGLAPDIEEELGNKIITGAAKYIPAMKKARLRKIHCGIVKSKGTVDIFDNQSDFHRRNYSGVDLRAPGWIDNSCMKFSYCEENAKEVIKLIAEESLKHSLKSRNDILLHLTQKKAQY